LLSFSNRKLILICVYILVILNLGIHSYSLFQSFKKLEIKVMVEKLKMASIAVKYLLPENFHLENLKTKKLSLVENQRIIRRLTRYANENNLRFVYSFYKNKDKVFFSASSIGKGEIIENPEVIFGFNFVEASQVLKKAFLKDGFSYEVSKDRWGDFFASYYSRRYFGTNNRWVAGAEYSTNKMEKATYKAFFQAIKGMIFPFLSLGLLIFVMRSTRKKENDIIFLEQKRLVELNSRLIYSLTHKNKKEKKIIDLPMKGIE